jgi:hypothetical protein
MVLVGVTIREARPSDQFAEFINGDVSGRRPDQQGQRPTKTKPSTVLRSQDDPRCGWGAARGDSQRAKMLLRAAGREQRELARALTEH